MTCAECLHWKAGLPFGTCQRIGGADLHGEPRQAGAVAYVDPDDPYIGVPFRTRSVFGCVLFRDKAAV